MKYSSIARPSRKLVLIGRGIMSPRGLATRPRMPAIWRTCIMFPRAPEPTIMSMGLNCSVLEAACSIASRTWSVASVQISTSFWRRSPSVMMPAAELRPRPSRPALLVVLEDPAFFAGGVLTSSIEMVSPDWAAKRKQRFLMASRLVATTAFG